MPLSIAACNSASESRGGAVGGAAYFDHGYIGAAVSGFRSEYGTVAEDEVTIGMKANRYALEGEVRNPGGLLQSMKWQLGRNEYLHTEFEGATVGTVFKNDSNDARLELRHAKP